MAASVPEIRSRIDRAPDGLYGGRWVSVEVNDLTAILDAAEALYNLPEFPGGAYARWLRDGNAADAETLDRWKNTRDAARAAWRELTGEDA